MDRMLSTKVIAAFQNKWVIVGILIFCGALIRLPLLSQPGVVVFDEVHFGKFATAYCCTHERFFDIHPPHGKLIIAAGATLGGYRTPFTFSNIGDAYPKEVPVFFFRLMPAVAGILLPVAVFAVLRLLNVSHGGAFAGGFLLAVDNAVWVQTRLIALDGVLWLFMLTAVACMLQAQKLNSLRQRAGWLVLCGAAMGIAVGTKLTGLTSGFLVAALLANEALERRTWNHFFVVLRETVWVGLPFILTYLWGWWLHFTLLAQPGAGDAFYRPTGAFIHDVVRMHQVMLSANLGLTVGHPDASSWWSWPFMAVPLYYWGQAERAIYFIGNPVVWWGTTAIGLTALMVWALQPVTKLRLPEEPAAERSLKLDTDQRKLFAIEHEDFHLALRVPAIGFFVSFLTLAGVSRSLFLYHYVPSLCFALIFAVAWLERCGWTEPGLPLLKQPLRYWAIIGVAIIGFVVMVPISGGISSFAWWRTLLFQVFPLWP